jgi:hypothetical protein
LALNRDMRELLSFDSRVVTEPIKLPLKGNIMHFQQQQSERLYTCFTCWESIIQPDGAGEPGAGAF